MTELLLLTASVVFLPRTVLNVMYRFRVFLLDHSVGQSELPRRWMGEVVWYRCIGMWKGSCLIYGVVRGMGEEVGGCGVTSDGVK
jgi:hypothetical protein